MGDFIQVIVYKMTSLHFDKKLVCHISLSHKHTERQRQRHFEVVTLGLTLGNGYGTDFQASQCIPMGPCCCRLTRRLTFGVFIPLTERCLTAKSDCSLYWLIRAEAL